MTPAHRQPRRFQVLHTLEGVVLALAPSETLRLEDGTQLGSDFVAAAGQLVTEIELTHEQMERPLAELFADHDVAVDFSARELVFTPRPKAS